MSNVKSIIAVASDRSEAGRLATAMNLALVLAVEDANIGILNADIYGPSQPMALGVQGQPESADGKTMGSMEGHGLQANSIGLLVEQDSPIVWRGPMVTSVLEQPLKQANWHDPDYLIVDMPPGVDDTQLMLSRKAPVTGAVIATIPRDIALLDAKEDLKMFEKVEIPIIDVVENTAMYYCPNYSRTEHIFSAGGGGKMCEQYGVPLLGSLPLNLSIHEQTDSGRPIVVADPDDAIVSVYKQIARRVAIVVARKMKDMAGRFPSIIVQST